ncbi:MAG: type II toxin-antitoxin system PemK/MazF family toxin [archaeon]|nr:type II toxin-antitoxin system PemK/MazF family toxin [archaeon]
MERLVKGDVVVIPFPFSDLSNAKKRPALVLTKLKEDDLILCQITSRQTKDNYSIPLSEKEFKSGTLKQDSNIRPNKIFTAHNSIIDYKIGSLMQTKTEKTVEAVCSIIKT